jgi:hypothetical protein
MFFDKELEVEFMVLGARVHSKVVLLILGVLLISCGGGSSNSKQTEKVFPKITDINIRGDLIKNQITIAEIECSNCIKSEASFTWKIEDEIVSTSNEFIPNEQYHGKMVKVLVTVPSIDQVKSTPKEAHFQRRLVTKTFSTDFMDVFLMSDGELILRSPNVYSWAHEIENKFIDFKSSTAGRGNILTLDEKGNYNEYRDDFYEIGTSTKFEDIKDQLVNVIDYWIDSDGHHALNQNNQVISWNVRESGQREHFELTNTKVENVKQVVSSIVDSSYGSVATAVLFNNGDLIIDALVDPNFGYQRYTHSNITKIQGIQLSNKPHSEVEYLAIFDQQDNVEIWSPRWGNQSYNNVDKIISKNDDYSFLVIMKDGSYIHSEYPDNHVVFDNSAKATDLVRTHHPNARWAVLTNDGTAVDISSGYPLEEWLLSPEFLLRNIAYSLSIKNANSFALVKTTGETFLSTEENYTIIENVKNIHTPDNYFLVVDGNNRLDSYFQRDSNRKIEPRGFSNGLDYVEDVATFFPLSSGALALDGQDYPTLVDTRDTVLGDTFIEKLIPKTTKLFFGSSNNE